MRKPDRETDKNSKLKFRVIEFVVEGDDAAIHEGLRSIQAAIARPMVQPAPMKYIAVGSGPVQAPVTQALVQDEPAPPETEMEFDAESTEPEAEDSPKDSPPRKAGQRRTTPKPLDSLDITAGPVGLEAFYKEKAPDSIVATCVVFIYWLKKFRATDTITASHVYTCYRMLGVNPPKSIYTALKDMRQKKKWLDKGDGDGEYKLNLLGNNAVERMTPKVP